MTPRIPTSRLGPLAGAAAAATIVASVLAGPGPVRGLRLLGGLLGMVSLPLAFWPFLTLHRHGRPAAGESYMATTAVVERGLYRVVRHPQYLAYLLFMAAFALLAQSRPVTVLAAVSALLLHLTTLAEERECAARFGTAYRAYLGRVPRYNVVAGLLRLRRRGGD